MTYELAKKLKDAGFPQEGSGFMLPFLPSYNDGFTPVQRVEECYAPTLSELIEACGKDFYDLSLNQYRKENKWEVRYRLEKEIDGEPFYKYPKLEGSSPEEAVAELWLRLRKPTVSVSP